MRSRYRRGLKKQNVSSRSLPRDLWSDVTGGVYCVASVTLAPVSVSFLFSLASTFAFSYPILVSLVSSSVQSFSVQANPPSYIQQTPSIYSFELDGVRKGECRSGGRGKGKRKRSYRCVNFPRATLDDGFSSEFSVAVAL